MIAGSRISRVAARWYRLLLRAKARRSRGVDLAAPAVVFSPHPDDETLGCGGTIAKKVRAGALVYVAYLTDGAASHPAFITRDRLKPLRRAEALAAVAVLGVPAAHVFFADIADGRLDAQLDAGTDFVRAIIDRCDPAEIYAPHPLDRHPDHRAASVVVRRALRLRPRKLVLYEYGTWFWNHWPLVDTAGYGRARQREARRRALRHSVAALTTFDTASHVADVLPDKSRALDQHKTQTVRMHDDPRWFVLSDIAGGQWLDALFGDYELFHRRRL